MFSTLQKAFAGSYLTPLRRPAGLWSTCHLRWAEPGDVCISPSSLKSVMRSIVYFMGSIFVISVLS